MGEQSYCAYDDITGVCKMRNKGVACYMVFADCTFVENQLIITLRETQNISRRVKLYYL
jgi:hypothetical protein